jgi:hypothetical protein
MRALIVLDNFRIGGLERLALDQQFILADLKSNPLALYRQEVLTNSLPNFLSAEKTRIENKEIEIVALPKSDLKQLIFIRKLFQQQAFSMIINHSLGAGVILRMALFFSRRRIRIKTFVHQLPSLSANSQRWKRFAYSLFSHEIYGYSKAVVEDWNSRTTAHVGGIQIRFGKRIELLRNGIYLERLPKITKGVISDLTVRRLVFIGRNVAWKNLNYLESLLNHPLARELTALLVLPEIDKATLNHLESSFPERIEFEIGKKIEDVKFYSSDINIYPVDYGPDSRFIESISLNCLEMACIGIPSLVTAGGTETWPELKDREIFVEVDWSNLEQVLSIIQEIKSISEKDQKLCQKIVDIRRNINQIMEW